MSSEKTSGTATSWILFIISTIVMIALIIFIPEWFWLALPFSLTYLVKAFDAM